jgi:hypothetical protein
MTIQPNLLSPAITSLNAAPPVRVTAGFGGPGLLRSVVGKVAALTTAYTAGGILRMVRLPSNAMVQEVAWDIDADVTTFDCDIGVYYSNGNDGTKPVNVAAADTAIDADRFASQLDMHLASTTGWKLATFEAGTFLPGMCLQPLWQASGLSEDPGGYLDICFTNTSTTNGAPIPSCRVTYILPA